jgi:Tol biopolymer transport system component
VVFASCAPNLVPHDTNRDFDVFVRDRVTGTTRRISVSSNEGQANDFSGETAAISSNGRYVVFDSWATNLVPGDTNRDSDVFLRDLAKGITERVSVADGGVQATGGSTEPAVSSDGRFVAFSSAAPNLAPGNKQVFDVYVRDRVNDTTRPVATSANGDLGNGSSEAPVITPSGRFIAFSSNSSDLVPEDTNGAEDIFVQDLG